VTLIDVAARPLAAALSADQSQQLLDAWSGLPIRFVGGVEVEGVRATGTGKQITTACGQQITVDHVVVAAGLQTPGRLAASAGLDFNHGIAVDGSTLATRVPGIHALGDCISIDGEVSRYIEPIGRQARLLADRITGAVTAPYVAGRVPLRIKTTSLPFTV
jgi:rubredoxin---NAD+ reductase